MGCVTDYIQEVIFLIFAEVQILLCPVSGWAWHSSSCPLMIGCEHTLWLPHLCRSPLSIACFLSLMSLWTRVFLLCRLPPSSFPAASAQPKGNFHTRLIEFLPSPSPPLFPPLFSVLAKGKGVKQQSVITTHEHEYKWTRTDETRTAHTETFTHCNRVDRQWRHWGPYSRHTYLERWRIPKTW